MNLFVVTYHVIRNPLGGMAGKRLSPARYAVVMGRNIRAAKCRLQFDMQGDELHIVSVVQQDRGLVHL